jgi:iron complex transport system permease protein
MSVLTSPSGLAGCSHDEAGGSNSLHRVEVLAALGLGLLGAIALSLAIGSNTLPLGQVWQALTHPDNSEAATIVREVRVPRTILGLLVGVALGAAGALMQGHTRNPLADPGLLGVSAGAALAVVLGVYAFSVTDPAATVWLGLAGALVASVVVFTVAAAGSSAVSPVPLALAGAAVSALLAAVTSFVVLNDQPTLDVYRRWVVGSLSGRGEQVVHDVAPFIIVGLVLALANTRALNALGLGEDIARSLGVRVLPARLAGLAGVTLLTGAATAAAGPIAFLGLVVPHVARALTGPDHRWLVPAAALAGADLLLLADVAGRLVGGIGELQVGVVLAVLGGPFFVAIARRRALVTL